MKRGDYGLGGILKCLLCSTHQKAGKDAAVRGYEAQAAQQRAMGGEEAEEETGWQRKQREANEHAEDRRREAVRPRARRRSQSYGCLLYTSPSPRDS